MADAAMTKNVPDVASVFKSSKLIGPPLKFKLLVAPLTLLMHALGRIDDRRVTDGWHS